MKEIVEAFTQAIHMNLAYCKYHRPTCATCTDSVGT
jgi:hypothetical protein